MAVEDQAPQGSVMSGRRAALVAMGVVAGALVFYLGMMFGSSSDIPANTTVLGVNIGGMSRSQAVATLDERITPVSQAPVSITAFATSEEIYPAESGMSFDPVATVEQLRSLM